MSTEEMDGVTRVEAEIQKPGYSILRGWMALHGGTSARIVLEEIAQLVRVLGAPSQPSAEAERPLTAPVTSGCHCVHHTASGSSWQNPKCPMHGQPDVKVTYSQPSAEAERSVGAEAATAACLDCGRAYVDFPLDVALPRAQWLLINPAEHGLLCAACIVARAAQVPGCTVAHMVLEVAPRAANDGAMEEDRDG